MKNIDTVREERSEKGQGVVIVNNIRRKIKGIVGRLLAPLSELQRTWGLDEQDKRTFRDLEDLKKSMRLNEKTRVMYVGCGNDSTVQKVFPQTINFDLVALDHNELRNFVEGDLTDIPYEDGSMDLVVQKAMYYQTETNPKFAKELARVLSPNGRLIRDFKRLNQPEELHEALGNLHYLLVLKHYHANGIILEKWQSTTNAIFKKGMPTPEQVKQIDGQLALYSEDFFSIFETISLKSFEETKESPFLKGRWAYHAALEFVLGIDLHSSEEAIIGQLQKLRQKLNPDTYEKIEIMVKVLKRDLKYS